MSQVEEILTKWGMTRENWECDPAFVADLITALDAVPTEELPQAQELLSRMLSITAHWHSSPVDCEKCRTVAEATKFLQDTGYGPDVYERVQAARSPLVAFPKHPSCQDVCQNPSRGDIACSKFCDMLPGSTQRRIECCGLVPAAIRPCHDCPKLAEYDLRHPPQGER